MVKKGSVAGIYGSNRTIILDGFLYGGNSGGPVYGIFPDEYAIKLIGIATQYIPNIHDNTIDNSGYSVAISAEIINEIISSFKKE